MELKKSPKANLEKRRIGYFQIGLVIALACTLVALEWKSFDKIQEPVSEIEFDVLEFDLPPTIPQPAAPQEIRQVNISLPPIISNITPVTPVTPTLPIVPPINPCIDCDIIGDPPITYVEPEDKTFIVVEDMPEFVGGIEAMMEYLEENLKYPSIAQEEGIQGKVYVEFVVSKDGSISEVVLKDDYDIGGGCGKEALRVVEGMPNWIPGKQRGEAVNVRFTLPITFRLQH